MPKVYTGDLTKMFDISGKKAMIFGGHGGFGKAIAEGYAANGCSVCISARNEAKLQEAVADIQAKAAPGVKVMYIAGDASDEEFVKKAVEVVTGPDGIGGASVLASASFDDESEAKRPSVQVGDPFMEKLLIECSLELYARDLVVGIQDLGAAGVSCAGVSCAGGSVFAPQAQSVNSITAQSARQISFFMVFRPFGVDDSFSTPRGRI